MQGQKYERLKSIYHDLGVLVLTKNRMDFLRIKGIHLKGSHI